MSQSIDWDSIARPPDFHQLRVTPNYLRGWVGCDRTESGLQFHCETAAGRAVDFRVDVVEPDIVRLRMNPYGIRPDASDLLARPEPERRSPPFDLEQRDESLILTTERLRVEFRRFPWQMRAYDIHEAAPFFSQRYDDRAYGPGYEDPPTGFDESADGRLTVRETIAVTPGEAFYGFGEKFTPLDKWGQEIISWAVDSGNVSSHRSYKNVPFFMSTAGYGVFVHTSFPIVYRLGSVSSISYSIHLDDSQLDYFLIYGPEFKHILKRYTGLTGPAPVPPKWSFGFWISRCGYKCREEVETVAHEMRARDFPCDVISLDPWWMGDGPWSTYRWDTRAFPEPARMIEGLRQLGLRTCLWITPYVPAGTPTYAEGLERGYFVRQADGEVSPVPETFTGTDLAAVDFTNPAAVTWFQSKLEALLDMGVAVFKTDFGEQAPVEALYCDGRSGLQMHNLYPVLYNRAAFELTERRFGRGLVWGRAGYAGSQRYPVQWGGDSYGSLDQLASQLRGLLSYGMSGVPFCSHDVGGFDYSPDAFDYATQADFPKDPVVYIRWLQFGVFSSHVRAHGKQPREPWTYGQPAETIARHFLKLRYRLLPYIYSEAVKCTQTGLPMVRPLVLEYQSDPNTRHLDGQYLFGENFLVAPVVTPTNRCSVYLPPGDWVNFWTKKTEPGGRWIAVDAPLEVLPLWVRAGAIIPMGPEMAYTEEKPLDPLILELYAPQGEAAYVVREEDKPDISVRYSRRATHLAVEVGPTPGQVEVVLYGVQARVAHCSGQSLSLLDCHGGQLVRFAGTPGGVTEFELEGE